MEIFRLYFYVRNWIFQAQPLDTPGVNFYKASGLQPPLSEILIMVCNRS